MGNSGSTRAKQPVKVEGKAEPEETSEERAREHKQSAVGKLKSALTEPAFQSAGRYIESRRKGKANVSKPGPLSCCAADVKKEGASLSESAESVATADDRLFASKRPQLTPEMVDFVLGSWVAIEDKLELVARRAFKNYFLANPEQMRFFDKFMEVFPDTVWDSDVFLEHVSLVMTVVKSVVERLREKSCAVSILHDVGYLHRDAQVPRESLLSLQPFFLESAEHFISQECIWTVELKEAWTQFFLFICHTISEKTAKKE